MKDVDIEFESSSDEIEISEDESDISSDEKEDDVEEDENSEDNEESELEESGDEVSDDNIDISEDDVEDVDEDVSEEENDDANPDEEGGINLFEMDDKPTAKTKTNFNRRKRQKPLKISKSARKKKKLIVIPEEPILDIDELRIKSRDLFETLTTKNNSISLEKNIYETLINSCEHSPDSLRNLYQNLCFEIFTRMKNTPKSKNRCKIFIDIVKTKKIGFQSSEFSFEKQLDDQNTKNIENPPKGKPSDAYTCGKCRKNKLLQHDENRGKNLTQYEMQTRSSDEPMTVFVQCLDCGSRWKTV